jgi:hypothetical protein
MVLQIAHSLSFNDPIILFKLLLNLLYMRCQLGVFHLEFYDLIHILFDESIDIDDNPTPLLVIKDLTELT